MDRGPRIAASLRNQLYREKLLTFHLHPSTNMASYTDEDLQNLIERVGVLGGYL